MKTSTPSIHSSAYRLILIFTFIILLTAPAPVRADIAPPPFPKAAGIYPNGVSTEVRMVSEVVDITIFDQVSQDFPDGHAQVKAIFHMLNQGTALEKMDVYFPLDWRKCEQDATKMRLYEFKLNPPMRDFHVLVGGTEVPFTTLYQRLRAELSTDPQETDVACWIYFPTLFPVGKTVTIEISYQTPAEADWGKDYPYIGYSYILQTGAGWKDTIGSADIAVHLPYPITPENLYGYSPDQGVAQGRDITWHFENFEPEKYKWNVDIGMLRPAIWKAIQAELKNTKTNPRDGEAWGRLGKAYKEALILNKGLRDDETGLKMYQAGVEAYQKAVDLKPNDADWHAGFAELLCNKAIWTFDVPDRARFPLCAAELKKALDLNPQQEKAKQLLGLMSWDNKVIDLSGPQPDYLILTPLPPTKTPQPTFTVTATATATATRLPTQAVTLTISPSQTPTPLALAAADTSAPTQTPAPSTSPKLCGSALLPAIILGWLWYWKRQER